MAEAPELRVHDDADVSIEHRTIEHRIRRLVLVRGAQAHDAKEESGVASTVANGTSAESLRDGRGVYQEGDPPRQCSPQWPDDEVAAGEDSTHVQPAAQTDPEIQTQTDLNKDKQTFAAEDSSGTRDKLGGRESRILAAVYELSSLFEPHDGVESALSNSSFAESTSICFSPWCEALFFFLKLLLLFTSSYVP